MGKQTGAEMIAAERTRQVDEERYTAEKDAGQAETLVDAAIGYGMAVSTVLLTKRIDPIHEWTVRAHLGDGVPPNWPWDQRYWKPTGDPVRDLVKAGALIAAAIDSLKAGA